MKHKPNIIVMSDDSDVEFRWMSDGWNYKNVAHTPEAQALFAKACACIEAGIDVADTIKRLKAAGFSIQDGRD